VPRNGTFDDQPVYISFVLIVRVVYMHNNTRSQSGNSTTCRENRTVVLFSRIIVMFYVLCMHIKRICLQACCVRVLESHIPWFVCFNEKSKVRGYLYHVTLSV